MDNSIDIRLCRGCGVELQHHPDLCPSNSDTRRGVWLDRQRGNTCQAGPRKGLHHQPTAPTELVESRHRIQPDWAGVFPAWYLRSVVTIHRCPCQWGPTGWCEHGRHEKCPRSEGWHRHGEPSEETHVVSRHGAALEAVWRAGTPCRWLCPCTCHQTTLALFDPPPPGERKTRHWGAGGNGYLAIGTTDQLTVDDEPQPALWDLP